MKSALVCGLSCLLLYVCSGFIASVGAQEAVPNLLPGLEQLVAQKMKNGLTKEAAVKEIDALINKLQSSPPKKPWGYTKDQLPTPQAFSAMIGKLPKAKGKGESKDLEIKYEKTQDRGHTKMQEEWNSPQVSEMLFPKGPPRGYAYKQMDYDQAGRVIREVYLDKDKKLHIGPESWAVHLQIYNPLGATIYECWFDAGEELVKGPEGYASRTSMYNRMNLEVCTIFYDEKDNPMKNAQGYAARVNLYMPDSGTMLAEWYFDESLLPANNIYGYAARVYAYDMKYLRLDRIFYLDEKRRLAKHVIGNHCIVYGYNDDGQRVSASYKVVPQAEKDIEDQAPDLQALLAEAQFCQTKMNFAQIRYQYALKGRMTSLQYYGLDKEGEGESTSEREDDLVLLDNNFDFATAFFEYNSKDRLCRTEFRNAKGICVRGPQYWSRRIMEYDGLHSDCVSQVVYSHPYSEKMLIYNIDGVCMQRFEYNNNKQLKREMFLDPCGGLTIGPLGYAIADYQYDDTRLTSITYYNAASALTTQQRGYAKLHFEHNSAGQCVRERYENIYGEAGVLAWSYDKVTWVRDARGREILRSYFINNKACMGPEGAHQVAYAYHDSGKIRAMAYYDTQDKLCFGKNNQAGYVVDYVQLSGGTPFWTVTSASSNASNKIGLPSNHDPYERSAYAVNDRAECKDGYYVKECYQLPVSPSFIGYREIYLALDHAPDPTDSAPGMNMHNYHIVEHHHNVDGKYEKTKIYDLQGKPMELKNKDFMPLTLSQPIALSGGSQGLKSKGAQLKGFMTGSSEPPPEQEQSEPELEQTASTPFLPWTMDIMEEFDDLGQLSQQHFVRDKALGKPTMNQWWHTDVDFYYDDEGFLTKKVYSSYANEKAKSEPRVEDVVNDGVDTENIEKQKDYVKKTTEEEVKKALKP